MSQEIVGLLSKIIFQSKKADNFLVAEFIHAKSSKRFRASGNIQLSPKADSKQLYQLIGHWEISPKYGETFVTLYCEPLRPTEFHAIEAYLANNVKGIGKITAKKLIQFLGAQDNQSLIKMCRDEKEKIFSFFGEKKRTIAQNFIETMTVDEIRRSVVMLLQEHNISYGFANRIYEKYKENAINLLRENPYRLIADFRQIGFLRADAIAQKLGLPATSLFRMEAAFIYALEMAHEEGHCYLPRNLLVNKACSFLAHNTHDSFLTTDFVLNQLRTIYKKNRENQTESFVFRDTSHFEKNTSQNEFVPEILFYLPDVLSKENEVAEFIANLIRNSLNKNLKEQSIQKELLTQKKTLTDLYPHLSWSELSQEQKTAVEMSFSSPFMVLTGGPGCGKTFVLKTIYNLQIALNRKVALCAPTGLAAKRMSASIGKSASTLHKLLGLGRHNKAATENDDFFGEDDFQSHTLEEVDVVIVDESSMLSLNLLHALVLALGPNKRIILVGDADQLPSIGAGNCLRDLIDCGKIPTARLTKIFRQNSQSPIPLAARDIILGKSPHYTYISKNFSFPKPESFAFVPCSSKNFYEFLLPFLSQTVKNIYQMNPIEDCQILVPMRKSFVGQENINKMIQSYLNPPTKEKKECVLPFGSLLREGDKVIQTKNNYKLDVFNGDLGYCRSISQKEEKIEIIIQYSERFVTYQNENLADLQLCYAMTVHKAQGSEFPMCIIPLFGIYLNMLDRNLLYTAITRARNYVILVGENWAIQKAISNQNAIKRFTFLEKLFLSIL